MFEPPKFIIELWPSIEDIHSSRMENVYQGRLTEFYESISCLTNNLHLLNLPVEPYTDNQIKKGKIATRAFPPVIVELVVWLGSSGIALALYKILKLWVDYKNGRRIKIVYDNLEVEATQLSKKQFSKLLDLVLEFRERLSPTKELKQILEEKGLTIRSVEDIERRKEYLFLKYAAQKRKKL